MARLTADQGPAAAGDHDSTPVPSNADRLRAHLKPEGLAAALLDAWLAGGPSDVQTRMSTALQDFHRPKQNGDDRAPTPEA
jgi:hypothetical protein